MDASSPLERLRSLEAEDALLGAATAAGEAVPAQWRALTPGRALKLLRKRRRLTQDRLARLAGMRQAWVARVERGAETTLVTLARLYAALGYELVLIPARRTR